MLCPGISGYPRSGTVGKKYSRTRPGTTRNYLLELEPFQVLKNLKQILVKNCKYTCNLVIQSQCNQSVAMSGKISPLNIFFSKFHHASMVEESVFFHNLKGNQIFLGYFSNKLIVHNIGFQGKIQCKYNLLEPL